jgi:hypothetical protein
MVVAMVAMGVMQVAIDQIVHVIGVRDRRMSAIWAVDMPGGVACAGMLGGATRRIRRANRQHVLDDASAGLRMVQMAVVKVIDMPIVLDGRMPAIRAVLMVVVAVNVSRCSHG